MACSNLIYLQSYSLALVMALRAGVSRKACSNLIYTQSSININRTRASRMACSNLIYLQSYSLALVMALRAGVSRKACSNFIYIFTISSIFIVEQQCLEWHSVNTLAIASYMRFRSNFVESVCRLLRKQY